MFVNFDFRIRILQTSDSEPRREDEEGRGSEPRVDGSSRTSEKITRRTRASPIHGGGRTQEDSMY